MSTYQTVVKNVCSDIITELQVLAEDAPPNGKGLPETVQIREARKEVLTKLLQITLRKIQDL